MDAPPVSPVVKIIGASVGGSLLLLASVGVMSGLLIYKKRNSRTGPIVSSRKREVRNEGPVHHSFYRLSEASSYIPFTYFKGEPAIKGFQFSSSQL